MLRKMMRSMNKGELRKVLYMLVAAMAIIGMVPNVGQASTIPADESHNAASLRQQNIDKIKLALEKKEVSGRLSDYGLTSQEVSSRLDQLTDQQISEMAIQADKINAGGDDVGMLVSVLLLILLILVILHLLGVINLKAPFQKKKPA